MTNGMKAKLSGEEIIAFGPFKHLIPKYEKPGVTKKIKRLFNRRIRHRLNSELEQDIVE